MKQKRREKFISKKTKRELRADAIKRVLTLALYNESQALSMHQIAKRMDLWPTSYLMGVLYDMAHSGELVMKEYKHTGGKCPIRYTFTIPPQKLAKAAAKAWAA